MHTLYNVQCTHTLYNAQCTLCTLYSGGSVYNAVQALEKTHFIKSLAGRSFRFHIKMKQSRFTLYSIPSDQDQLELFTNHVFISKFGNM